MSIRAIDLIVGGLVITTVSSLTLSPLYMTGVGRPRAMDNFTEYLNLRNEVASDQLTPVMCSSNDSDGDGYVTCLAVDDSGKEVIY